MAITGPNYAKEFIAENGGKYAQVDNLLYFKTGAVMEVGMMTEHGWFGRSWDPPTNDYERLGNQIWYWRGVLLGAEQAFHKVRDHIAEDIDQYTPQQIRKALTKARGDVRAVRDKLKELREARAKTPEGRHIVERQRVDEHLEATRSEARDALKKIKI